MIVVAAGRALHGHPRLAGIEGHVSCGVDVVGAVGVGGIDGHLAEVPAAAPEALLVVDQMPGSAGVVGDVDATGGFGGVGAAGRGHAEGRRDGRAQVVDDGVEAVGIRRRDGDADFANEAIVGQAVGELMPIVAAVSGFPEAAAGQVRRRVNGPRRAAGGPQRSIDGARMPGIEREIECAHVVGVGLV